MGQPARQPKAAGWQKKRLHWGANLLGLEDDSYRALLQGATGKTSSLDLSRVEAAKALAALENRLRAVSITPPWVSEYPAQLANLGDRKGMASQKQLRFIWSLWRKWRAQPGRRAANPSDIHALGGFLHSQFGLADVRFLDRSKAKQVIDVLKEMVNR